MLAQLPGLAQVAAIVAVTSAKRWPKLNLITGNGVRVVMRVRWGAILSPLAACCLETI